MKREGYPWSRCRNTIPFSCGRYPADEHDEAFDADPAWDTMPTGRLPWPVHTMQQCLFQEYWT